jgi:hypothetical protein
VASVCQTNCAVSPGRIVPGLASKLRMRGSIAGPPRCDKTTEQRARVARMRVAIFMPETLLMSPDIATYLFHAH